MPSAEREYEKLVSTLTASEGVTSGQMFGKPCLKVGGKAFVVRHGDVVVFKLSGPAHTEALNLAGAVLWDPSGKGRPMKAWVALEASHAERFASLADAALAYVSAA